MTTPDWLRLDAQLCFRLYTASRLMTRCYQPLLAELGLTYPQYLAMLVLWEGDGVTVKQLGERLRLDSGTLTPLLKRLQALDLVARTRRPDNERELAVTLTAAGRALRERAAEVPAAMLERVGLDAGEAAELVGLLDKLTTAAGRAD
ncbi:MarR family winged helix-turn-helix transcriptional regulator [Chitinolyticbacter meiyuanensis]|uniref:MarR family winged helix-turn-helix transcriptional regulator n=1 Tax=Chitinolyticbacter meiyuanensis TaxID=682798 RepID=UPI0011E5FEC7|nr:MarR family transcriptional regulator [Chitinolyticbacter meiyuanensis]